MDFIINIVAKLIVPFFFIGTGGSAVVILVSLFGDIKEMLEDRN